MFDFQNLEVYKKSNEFYLDCKELIIEKIGDENIKQQLGRASLSIPLNIAEGCAKFSSAYRKNFFIISRASVYECVAILEILMRTKVISKEKYESMEQKAAEISKILFVMIRNLMK
jgi:four helix bundle protein